MFLTDIINIFAKKVMKEVNYEGDIISSTADIIAHQVNCKGKMGSGVAKAIKDKYPRVYEQYMKAFDKNMLKLGMCQVVNTNPDNEDNRLVANLCGQEDYGYDGKRYTNYEGLYTSLEKLAAYCILHDIKTIAFPWKMASDRGGADWMVVCTMIEAAFRQTDVIIEYWKY